MGSNPLPHLLMGSSFPPHLLIWSSPPPPLLMMSNQPSWWPGARCLACLWWSSAWCPICFWWPSVQPASNGPGPSLHVMVLCPACLWWCGAWWPACLQWFGPSNLCYQSLGLISCCFEYCCSPCFLHAWHGLSIWSKIPVAAHPEFQWNC